MERRSFLKWAVNGINAVIAAILGLPALFYLIDPRRRVAQPSRFRRVAPVAGLPLDQPTQFAIVDTHVDAWTRHAAEPVGRVWLIRRTASPENVEAYTAICPHMGCSINFDGANRRFACPCHGGTWDLACRRLDPATNPARRDMDSLDVELQTDSNTKEAWVAVRYESFVQNLPEKNPKV